jgi:hypothetical protein
MNKLYEYLDENNPAHQVVIGLNKKNEELYGPYRDKCNLFQMFCQCNKEKTEESYNPYCSICDSCGEDGCCSALNCKQSNNGKYCETYLKELQFGYRMFKELYNLIDEKGDEEMKKSLDELYDKNYDLTWKKDEEE